MAVKIMPTCIPLTAKICDAPAREKSFFTVDVRSDLSAMQSALHRAEVSDCKCFVKTSAIKVLAFWAKFSIELNSSFGLNFVFNIRKYYTIDSVSCLFGISGWNS